jgi:hypothetical protein
MTRKQIGVSQEAKKFILDFQDFELDVSQIAERVGEIVPILEQIFAADVARDQIPDANLRDLLPGILARDMIYQATLYKAALHAESVYDVASGRKSISDLGFPDLLNPVLQDD